MANKQSFSIAESAAAFKVLSSNLYSKPELAVLRELSTNAYDAQIDAGTNNEHPIELHIPTSKEPFFYVRDWGNGISEDEIYVMYTEFFSSTKTQSEDQIGAFGLGSKSPFAVTDEYTVKSYQNGIVKEYLMKVENSTPTVSLVSTNDTDEHDGLEIVIDSWHHEPTYTWMDEAFNLFSTTAFLPNSNLQNMDSILKRRNHYTKEDIIFSEDEYTSTNISVNVAGVGFDLSWNDKRDYIPSELLRALNMLGISEINIMVKKNDVELTPSRESLHFSKKTQEAVKAGIIEYVNRYFSDSLNDIKKMAVLQGIRNFDIVQTFFPDLSVLALEAQDLVRKSVNAVHYEIDNFDKKHILMMEKMPGNKVPYRMTFISISDFFKKVRKDRVCKYFSLDLSGAPAALKKSYEKFITAPLSTCSSNGIARGNLVCILFSQFENYLEKDRNVDYAFYFLEKDISKLTSFISFESPVICKNFKSYYNNFKVEKAEKAEAKKKEVAFVGPFFVSSTCYFLNGKTVSAKDILENKEAYAQKQLACIASDNYYGSMAGDCEEMLALSRFLGEDHMIAFRRGTPSWIEKLSAKKLCIEKDSFYKGVKNLVSDKYKLLASRVKANRLIEKSDLKDYFTESHNIDPRFENTFSGKVFKNYKNAPELTDLGFSRYDSKSNLVIKSIISDDEDAKVSDVELKKLEKENNAFALLDACYTSSFSSSKYTKALQIYLDAAFNELDKE